MKTYILDIRIRREEQIFPDIDQGTYSKEEAINLLLDKIQQIREDSNTSENISEVVTLPEDYALAR